MTGDADLVVVPTDRTFILTGVVSRELSWNIWEVGTSGSTPKVRGSTLGAYTYEGSTGPQGYLAAGRGTIPFGPGTTVRVSTGQTVSLDLQGYLAAP